MTHVLNAKYNPCSFPYNQTGLEPGLLLSLISNVGTGFAGCLHCRIQTHNPRHGPMIVSGLTVVGLTFNWALLLVPSLVLE